MAEDDCVVNDGVPAGFVRRGRSCMVPAMVAAPRYRHFTYDEYVELERDTGLKHEYLDGMVWAMAGGTPRHAMLILNLGSELRVSLKGRPCQPYSSELKVRVRATTLTTYPDVSVICGPIERAPEDRNAVMNPTLVAEVLSPSTERWDRHGKLQHYQQIPSLRHVLFVHVDEALVEHLELRDGQWHTTLHRPGDHVVLAALDVALDVDALYADLPEG